MFNFLLKLRYSDRRGTDKNYPGQNLPDKKPEQTPEQKPREPLREILYRGFLTGLSVLLKIGGPRFVTYFKGVQRCVTKCDRGGGRNWSKIG